MIWFTGGRLLCIHENAVYIVVSRFHCKSCIRVTMILANLLGLFLLPPECFMFYITLRALTGIRRVFSVKAPMVVIVKYYPKLKIETVQKICIKKKYFIYFTFSKTVVYIVESKDHSPPKSSSKSINSYKLFFFKINRMVPRTFIFSIHNTFKDQIRKRYKKYLL